MNRDWGRANARGATLVRLVLTKIPAGDATGIAFHNAWRPASLNFGYGPANFLAYTLCPDNGGNSGPGYSGLLFALQLQGPFHASVRAGFSPFRSRASRLLSVPPVQRVLFLFTAFCNYDRLYQSHLQLSSGFFEVRTKHRTILEVALRMRLNSPLRIRIFRHPSEGQD